MFRYYERLAAALEIILMSIRYRAPLLALVVAVAFVVVAVLVLGRPLLAVPAVVVLLLRRGLPLVVPAVVALVFVPPYDGRASRMATFADGSCRSAPRAAMNLS